jgi:hypothetical protein
MNTKSHGRALRARPTNPAIGPSALLRVLCLTALLTSCGSSAKSPTAAELSDVLLPATGDVAGLGIGEAWTDIAATKDAHFEVRTVGVLRWGWSGGEGVNLETQLDANGKVRAIAGEISGRTSANKLLVRQAFDTLTERLGKRYGRPKRCDARMALCYYQLPRGLELSLLYDGAGETAMITFGVKP